FIGRWLSCCAATQKFSTDDYDIGFSATFLPEEGINSVVIIPNGRVDSQILEQTGKYEAREAGTLTLAFDNSYSKLRGKTLHLSYYVETDLGDGFTGFASSKNVVHTPFGPGSIVETRPNGSVVVDLLFGRAFLQEDAIISRQEGPLQADTIHQLHRVNLVRSMVRSNNFGADDAEEVKESKGVDEPSYDDEEGTEGEEKQEGGSSSKAAEEVKVEKIED
ncbi:AlNc14C11G1388, partial [Symbiodinium sp. KB8]